MIDAVPDARWLMPRNIALRTRTGPAGMVGARVAGAVPVVGAIASNVTSVLGDRPERRSTTFLSSYAFANRTHASATATALESTTRTTWLRTSQGMRTNENASQPIATAVRMATA